MAWVDRALGDEINNLDSGHPRDTGLAWMHLVGHTLPATADGSISGHSHPLCGPGKAIVLLWDGRHFHKDWKHLLEIVAKAGAG